MSLPKWTDHHDCFCVPDPCPMYQALSIAWEALEQVPISGSNVWWKDAVRDAMRRISELGDTSKASIEELGK